MLARIRHCGLNARMIRIPAFALYGDPDPAPATPPDVLHCESIAARSVANNWRFRPHRHPRLAQFFWFQDGGGWADVEGARTPLGPRHALYIPNMAIHGFAFEPGTRGWVVTVPLEVLHAALGVDSAARTALRGPVHTRGDAALRGLFAQVAGEYDGGAPFRTETLRGLAGLIGLWFARGAVHDARRPPAAERPALRLARIFLALVETRFTQHEPVAAYARALAVTPTHLTRICRQELGATAQALIHQRLVDEAKRMLAYTAQPVHQIGFDLGFADPAYFSRFLAARLGMAPTRYRAAIAAAQGQSANVDSATGRADDRKRAAASR
ncbi:MAG: helix-turn-helix domain-containing protein [Alphaproteobacteria bacterium]